jgi:F0F1-type ATP synthase gamma subunit
VKLICVGRRGYQFFSKRGYPIALYRSMPTSGAGLEDARAVADAVQEMFISGERETACTSSTRSSSTL